MWTVDEYHIIVESSSPINPAKQSDIKCTIIEIEPKKSVAKTKRSRKRSRKGNKTNKSKSIIKKSETKRMLLILKLYAILYV